MPDMKTSRRRGGGGQHHVTFGPLNDMEHRCRFDSDVLVERPARQTLYRANRLFMEAYTEILELDACFKD